MSRLKSIEEIYTDPEAKLGPLPTPPTNFAELAGRSTLHLFYGNLYTPDDLELHKLGLETSTWFAVSQGVLPDKQIITARNISVITDMLQPNATKRARLYDREIKKTNGEINEMSNYIFKLLYEKNPVSIYRTELSEDTKAYKDLRNPNGRTPLHYQGLDYENSWSQLQELVKRDASALEIRDRIITSALSRAIAKEREKQDVAGDPINEGFSLYSPLNAGVAYMLQELGMPKENLIPNPIGYSSDDEDDDTEVISELEKADLEQQLDQIRSFKITKGPIAVQDISPDGLVRITMKRRLGLPVTEHDKSQALLINMVSYRVAAIKDARPDIDSRRIKQFFAQVCDTFTEDEVKDLFDTTTNLDVEARLRVFDNSYMFHHVQYLETELKDSYEI